MCFTDKRKRNWIRKEDCIPDLVLPSGRVGSGWVRGHEPSHSLFELDPRMIQESILLRVMSPLMETLHQTGIRANS